MQGNLTRALFTTSKMTDKRSVFQKQTQSFLQGLGLDKRQSRVFSTLAEQGPLTILGLARQTDLPRTTVYRLVDELKEQNLLEEIAEENTTLVQAVDFAKLELRLQEKESKLAHLKTTLPQLKGLLQQHQSLSGPGTRVKVYRGKDGLKQLLWNTLKADEIVGYTFLSLDDVVGRNFADKYREEKALRKIKQREILSDDDQYLNNKTLKYMRTSPLFEHYEPRYLPAEKIKVDSDMVVYDDIVSFYNWYEGDTFGVELHNQGIATLQKRIFEMLWEASATADSALAKKTPT